MEPQKRRNFSRGNPEEVGESEGDMELLKGGKKSEETDYIIAHMC